MFLHDSVFPLTFYNVDRGAGDGPDGRHQERVLPADDVAPRAEVAGWQFNTKSPKELPKHGPKRILEKDVPG